MAKTTVEFSDAANSELKRMSEEMDATKASVIRNALALYVFVVDELKESKNLNLGITQENIVRKIIAVPGIPRKS